MQGLALEIVALMGVVAIAVALKVWVLPRLGVKT